MTIGTITAIAGLVAGFFGAVLGAGIAWGRNAEERRHQAAQLAGLAASLSDIAEDVGKTSARLDVLATKLEGLAEDVDETRTHERRLVLLERANGKDYGKPN